MTGINFSIKIINISIKSILVLYLFIKQYVYINKIIFTNNYNTNE